MLSVESVVDERRTLERQTSLNKEERGESIMGHSPSSTISSQGESEETLFFDANSSLELDEDRSKEIEMLESFKILCQHQSVTIEEMRRAARTLFSLSFLDLDEAFDYDTLSKIQCALVSSFVFYSLREESTHSAYFELLISEIVDWQIETAIELSGQLGELKSCFEGTQYEGFLEIYEGCEKLSLYVQKEEFFSFIKALIEAFERRGIDFLPSNRGEFNEDFIFLQDLLRLYDLREDEDIYSTVFIAYIEKFCGKKFPSTIDDVIKGLLALNMEHREEVIEWIKCDLMYYHNRLVLREKKEGADEVVESFDEALQNWLEYIEVISAKIDTIQENFERYGLSRGGYHDMICAQFYTAAQYLYKESSPHLFRFVSRGVRYLAGFITLLEKNFFEEADLSDTIDEANKHYEEYQESLRKADKNERYFGFYTAKKSFELFLKQLVELAGRTVFGEGRIVSPDKVDGLLKKIRMESWLIEKKQEIIEREDSFVIGRSRFERAQEVTLSKHEELIEYFSPQQFNEILRILHESDWPVWFTELPKEERECLLHLVMQIHDSHEVNELLAARPDYLRNIPGLPCYGFHEVEFFSGKQSRLYSMHFFSSQLIPGINDTNEKKEIVKQNIVQLIHTTPYQIEQKLYRRGEVDGTDLKKIHTVPILVQTSFEREEGSQLVKETVAELEDFLSRQKGGSEEGHFLTQWKCSEYRVRPVFILFNRCCSDAYSGQRSNLQNSIVFLNYIGYFLEKVSGLEALSGWHENREGLKRVERLSPLSACSLLENLSRLNVELKKEIKSQSSLQDVIFLDRLKLLFGAIYRYIVMLNHLRVFGEESAFFIASLEKIMMEQVEGFVYCASYDSRVLYTDALLSYYLCHGDLPHYRGMQLCEGKIIRTKRGEEGWNRFTQLFAFLFYQEYRKKVQEKSLFGMRTMAPIIQTLQPEFIRAIGEGLSEDELGWEIVCRELYDPSIQFTESLFGDRIVHFFGQKEHRQSLGEIEMLEREKDKSSEREDVLRKTRSMSSL